MNQRAYVAQDHKTAGEEEEETVEKSISHVPPGEGARSLWVMGVLVTYKIPSHTTGGAYALFEVATPPGSGPPPHVHHREDEAFYVLEGELEFLNGRKALRVGAGSLIYVPKGTPRGLYEHFFEEIGKSVDGGRGALVFEDQPAAERIVEVAATYGIEIPTPIAE